MHGWDPRPTEGRQLSIGSIGAHVGVRFAAGSQEPPPLPAPKILENPEDSPPFHRHAGSHTVWQIFFNFFFAAPGREFHCILVPIYFCGFFAAAQKTYFSGLVSSKFAKNQISRK